uniref:Uncharacterized protein n=1 Tax=Ciona intestinalis TaxID=7719 RepID=H2XPS8_CIOIN
RLKLVVLIVTSSIVSTLFLNTYIYNHHTRRKTNEIRLTQQEKVQYLVQENQQIRPAETPIPEVPVETERPSLKTVLDIQKNFDQENENVENMTDEPTEEKLVSIDPSTKDLCPKFPTELIGNLNVESSLKPSLILLFYLVIQYQVRPHVTAPNFIFVYFTNRKQNIY